MIMKLIQNHYYVLIDHTHIKFPKGTLVKCIDDDVTPRIGHFQDRVGKRGFISRTKLGYVGKTPDTNNEVYAGVLLKGEV